MKAERNIAIAGLMTALLSFSAVPVARAQNGGAGRNSNGGPSTGPSTGSGGGSGAHDPGPRAGSLGAGTPLSTLKLGTTSILRGWARAI